MVSSTLIPLLLLYQLSKSSSDDPSKCWKPLPATLKGKYHANLMSFQKPTKMFSVNRNKKQSSSFVLNYHPSAIKLSISASGQIQNRSGWTET